MAPVGWRSDQEIADLMGTARRMVVRCRAQGLTYWWADRLATALRRHPSDIWPDWWDVTGLMVLVDDGTISHVEARALCGAPS